MGSCEGTCNFCEESTWIRIWCDICGVDICEECRLDYLIDETGSKENRLICIDCNTEENNNTIL